MNGPVFSIELSARKLIIVNRIIEDEQVYQIIVYLNINSDIRVTQQVIVQTEVSESVLLLYSVPVQIPVYNQDSMAQVIGQAVTCCSYDYDFQT